jgi:peptidoglycan hydrolase-like protein with peptidoglycan-binding domain
MIRTATRLRFILLIGVAGVLGWFQPLNLPSALGDQHQGAGSSETANTNWHATAAELRQVQERLQQLGFDAGPADGLMGQRTKAALQAYQRSIDASADGKLTNELYQRLTAQPDLAVPSAQQGPAGSVEGTCSAAIEGSWQFEDDLGSKFALTLRQDGSVADTPYPRHWRWQATEDDVEITYDNGMGTTVTRVGRLTSGVMLGDATDSHGRAWAWKAVRTSLQPASDQDTCEVSLVPGE